MTNQSVINLYTALANDPDKDFGWDTGLINAKNLGYKKEWLETIPEEVWRYCAAVGNPFDAGVVQDKETVLDIGCGAGVDLCIASLLVGKQGHVYGVDITPAIVKKARQNVALAGLTNITVYECSFEELPLEDSLVDTVISNGSINLAASKEAVFSEIHRVLAHGGKLFFSDMIRDENFSGEGACEHESWANCVAGTLRSDQLIQLLTNAGFVNAELLSTNHYKTSPSSIGATFKAEKI